MFHSQSKAGAASLCPVATVEGAETLNICIKKSCSEYEVCGGPQSKEVTETHLLSTTSTLHSQVSESKY